MSKSLAADVGTDTQSPVRESRASRDPARPLMRVNNFDLIRLVAALQVLIEHALTHLHLTLLAPLGLALDFFPGVPIFFAVSGFLISMSWERAPSLRQYVRNRILRIYPGLWVCLLVSVLIFVSAGVRPPSAPALLLWVIAQLTFVQFYNPPFLRAFGVGVLNGSLWTIAVELQFYLVLPVLASFARRRRLGWLILAIVSCAAMIIARQLMQNQQTLPQKILGVSLLPYLFFFLVGVIARLVYERRPGLFRGKALYWFGAYLVWICIQTWFDLPGSTGNTLGVLSIGALSMLVVSCAFTAPSLSGRLIKGNDISYGVYIYHMPLINLLLFLGMIGVQGFLLAIGGTLLAAIASWRFIERPALRLKGYSLRWAEKTW
jgi:peptidoglycan/LPS O-acetylase OafA/YrhL